MSYLTQTFAPHATEARPPCPECTVALDPTGRGRYLYWTCRYCGITMRRS